MKRVCIVLVAILLSGASAWAQKKTCTTASDDIPWLGIETIRLWTGPAPQAHGDTCQDIPTLTVFDPQPGQSNGSAIVILPGGAYVNLAAILEGREVADWFTTRGFRAFVLQYRLSSNGYLLPVPLLDARRAMQLVRSRAADYHIDPNRIGIIGFSAGGHLAALASVQPVPGNPDADDPTDRVSSRPDFLVLGYPWIGAISSDTSHLSYCKIFNVMDRCEALRTAYSPDLFVTKETPPTFWYHTTDDETVPLEQGLRFFDAEVKAGVTVEAHVFMHGHHGSGFGMGNPSLDQWPVLLETWLRGLGMIPEAKPR